MADDRPLVWLPFEPAELGDPPEGLRYKTVVATGADVPASAADVQTLTAGVDHVRDEVPEGVVLCNGRGIHNASTAELALTLTLASLRGIPGFVLDQQEERWDDGWRSS